MTSKRIRKGVETLKALVHTIRATLRETNIIYYGLNRNIVVSLGKEINRDPVSSGERTQDSLVKEMYRLIFWKG